MMLQRTCKEHSCDVNELERKISPFIVTIAEAAFATCRLSLPSVWAPRSASAKHGVIFSGTKLHAP